MSLHTLRFLHPRYATNIRIHRGGEQAEFLIWLLCADRFGLGYATLDILASLLHQTVRWIVMRTRGGSGRAHALTTSVRSARSKHITSLHSRVRAFWIQPSEALLGTLPLILSPYAAYACFEFLTQEYMSITISGGRLLKHDIPWIDLQERVDTSDGK